MQGSYSLLAINLNWPRTWIYKFINFKISTPGFSLKLICHKTEVEILLPKMTRYSKLISNTFASVCNPVWLVKKLLMQDTHTYLASLPRIIFKCLSSALFGVSAHENIVFLARSFEARLFRYAGRQSCLLGQKYHEFYLLFIWQL